MAASQGNPEIKIVEALEQLVQENRALKVEVGAMRVQMTEMMSIMQALKNEITAKATAEENPGGTAAIVLSPRPDALPLPGSGIRHLAHTPEAMGQNHPATQTMDPGIMPQGSPPSSIPPPITTPQVQNTNPKNLPQALHFSIQARKSHKTPKYQERKQFDPIPTSYSDLFNHLLSNNLISPHPMKSCQPPFSKSFNPNVTCKFHADAIGHSIEDCKVFKNVVQDLIESRWFSFDDGSTSNLHARKKVKTSAVMDQGGSSQYDLLPMSYTDLCSFLIRHKFISPRKMKLVQPPFPKGHDPKATCEFHSGAVGHSVRAVIFLSIWFRTSLTKRS